MNGMVPVVHPATTYICPKFAAEIFAKRLLVRSGIDPDKEEKYIGEGGLYTPQYIHRQCGIPASTIYTWIQKGHLSHQEVVVGIRVRKLVDIDEVMKVKNMEHGEKVLRTRHREDY